MKYHAYLPLSALSMYFFFYLLWTFEIIPAPSAIAESIRDYEGNLLFLLLFAVIALESIIYIGFYFPGQLIAVVLVLLSNPSTINVFILTLISMVAVTCSAAINYFIGYFSFGRFIPREERGTFSFRELLIAMVHINILALYLYRKGTEAADRKVIFFTGILNLPYYFLIILIVLFLGERVLLFEESEFLIVALIVGWLLIALLVDILNIMKERERRKHLHNSD